MPAGGKELYPGAGIELIPAKNGFQSDLSLCRIDRLPEPSCQVRIGT